MVITEEMKEASFEHWQDDAGYQRMLLQYGDRKAMSHEARNKRKALESMNTENPFYHRSAASAEMAQMRLDMAYIVEENKKLREMIETIGFLHQRVDVVYGAYAHMKMLADKSRIDYAMTESAIKDILKLKKELTNEVEHRRDKPDGIAG